MPQERPRATVCTQRRADGSSEVFVADPRTGRLARTGLTGSNDQETKKLVEEVARTMHKSSEVSVREV
jgi:hypothetical protein